MGRRTGVFHGLLFENENQPTMPITDDDNPPDGDDTEDEQEIVPRPNDNPIHIDQHDNNDDGNITKEGNEFLNNNIANEEIIERKDEEVHHPFPQPEPHQYKLCPRSPITYGPYAHVNTGISDLHEKILTQYTMSKGLSKFGDDGVTTVLSELQQIHNMKAIILVNSNDLIYNQKLNTLRYHMFLKQNHNDCIKSLGCADRRTQCNTITDANEISSPTITTESVLLTCALEDNKG